MIVISLSNSSAADRATNPDPGPGHFERLNNLTDEISNEIAARAEGKSGALDNSTIKLRLSEMRASVNHIFNSRLCDDFCEFQCAVLNMMHGEISRPNQELKYGRFKRRLEAFKTQLHWLDHCVRWKHRIFGCLAKAYAITIPAVFVSIQIHPDLLFRVAVPIGYAVLPPSVLLVGIWIRKSVTARLRRPPGCRCRGADTCRGQARSSATHGLPAA